MNKNVFPIMRVTINLTNNLLHKNILANSSELKICGNYFSARVSK